LTGRENLYIGGAILGLSKRQVDAKLDAIVDFAGIRSAIDTPVKHYSSGMYVRLGFSLAVHCEPDVLLIDEILAVGDVEFRKRCYRRLAEMRERGATWVIVSHDLGVIRSQASRAIVLQEGNLRFEGPPDEAVSRYLYLVSEETRRAPDRLTLPDTVDERAWGGHIAGLSIERPDGHEGVMLVTGEHVRILIDYVVDHAIEDAAFGLAFHDGQNNLVFGINTRQSAFEVGTLRPGPGRIVFELPSLPFYPGVYRVRAALHDRNMAVLDDQNDALYLKVKHCAGGTGEVYCAHQWVLADAD
jgi:hypothetical protein